MNIQLINQKSHYNRKYYHQLKIIKYDKLNFYHFQLLTFFKIGEKKVGPLKSIILTVLL